MWMDVVELRNFYRTSLGAVAARLLRARIRELWPDTAGLAILGLGYAVPVLPAVSDDAGRLIAAMPAAQGILHWPRPGPNRTVLVDEADLPLPDNSMDRIILLHALENSEQLRPMLREIWRVLSDSGRVLVVVPNRRGVWALLERTPFGHGHPYTPGQLSRLMRDCLFTPTREAGALYVPPARSRMMLGAARAWEKTGARWFPRFSGLLLMEGSKQLYGMTLVESKSRRKLRGIAVPAAARRKPQAFKSRALKPKAPDKPKP